MKKYLALAGIIVGVVSLVAIFPMLNGRLESPKITPQGEVIKNIMFIVGRAKIYVETSHLTSLDNKFKDKFLTDPDTISDLSSASLSVASGKVVDSSRISYEIEIAPPGHIQVTASDGQKFGVDILP